MRTRRPRQHGQTLVFAALFLASFMAVLVYAEINVAQLFGAYHEVDTAAMVGAESGAAEVDVSKFYEGVVALAPDAEARCKAAGHAQLDLVKTVYSNPAMTCAVNGSRVTATATVRIDWFATGLGASPLNLTSSRTAQGAFGRERPVSPQNTP